jgi:hypothetical protein
MMSLPFLNFLAFGRSAGAAKLRLIASCFLFFLLFDRSKKTKRTANTALGGPKERSNFKKLQGFLSHHLFYKEFNLNEY